MSKGSNSLSLSIIETFGSGITVSVVVASGAVFIGQIVGEVRHHEEPPMPITLENEIEPEFLLLKLTAATGPYVIGQTIAINVLLIETIG